MTPEATNLIDGHQHELKCMAEFASVLGTDSLDANGAKEGYFPIRQAEGNQLAFAATKSFAASMN